MNSRPSHPVGDDLASLAERVRAVHVAPARTRPTLRVTGVTLRSQDAARRRPVRRAARRVSARRPLRRRRGAPRRRRRAHRRGGRRARSAADVGVPVLVHPAPAVGARRGGRHGLRPARRSGCASSA